MSDNATLQSAIAYLSSIDNPPPFVTNALELAAFSLKDGTPEEQDTAQRRVKGEQS